MKKIKSVWTSITLCVRLLILQLESSRATNGAKQTAKFKFCYN